MQVYVWPGRRDYWGHCDRSRSQKVSRIQGSDKMDMYSFILTQKKKINILSLELNLLFLNKGLEKWDV